MICERCGELIRSPKMEMGGSWLWQCPGCSKLSTAPAQQWRGSVTMAGGVQLPCISAVGTIGHADEEPK